MSGAAKAIIAIALLLAAGAVALNWDFIFTPEPSATDFRAYTAVAAAARSDRFVLCRLSHSDPNDAKNSRAGIVRCMERYGYSHDPR